MLLELGTTHEFQFRTLDSVAPPVPNLQPHYLMLDGQQRLTALHQALGSHLTNAQTGPRYFISIPEALDTTDEARGN